MATRFLLPALGTAQLQVSGVSKKVGGLPSWSTQADSPATALTVGGWIRSGGKTSGVGMGLFWHIPFSKQQCLLEAMTGNYLVLSLPWPAESGLTIIAELSGRHREPPSVLGGEGEIFGTEDILSWGPADTHWSHVYIPVNSVRYILQVKIKFGINFFNLGWFSSP